MNYSIVQCKTQDVARGEKAQHRHAFCFTRAQRKKKGQSRNILLQEIKRGRDGEHKDAWPDFRGNVENAKLFQTATQMFKDMSPCKAVAQINFRLSRAFKGSGRGMGLCQRLSLCLRL